MDLDAEFPRNQSLSTSNQDREGVRDNAALSNRSKQWVSFADQPGIENEINNPIATSNSTHNLCNLDSSGLRCSSRTEVMKQCGKVYSNTTTLMNQGKHTCARQAHKVSNLPWRYSLLSVPLDMDCHVWLTLYRKKVTVTSTAKVSFSNNADAKINNASSFRHTACSTLQLVVASVDNKFSKGSTKSNNTLPFSDRPNNPLMVNLHPAPSSWLSR
jgi:hypothetical protein